ncbi:transcriptional regulator BetI [Novosphingobium sp. KCTC 2891]|uniref:transcriptional regulator BetI n=1 Tax=Novosphingobium sp. KCTC 2891 TaxID=2989730 RepID=UPI00222285CE|nr:transcriptional regulator BetI [Novosphingobium sp. KCTC 2891]MCW1381408.1 transcriptional regulator BetI [Novosphingobium sp. KCTC 2891]
MKEPAYRRSEPDARRRSLIEACMRVLGSEGAAGASVRAIAREAGVSPGLVNHYFDGVDALIAETYGEVDRTVRAHLAAAVEGAGSDPRARLEAFVTGSFTAPIADPRLLATWIAFWSLVAARPEIARQHDQHYAGFRQTLEALLADCGVAPAALRRTAIGVTALVDGLWLELCLSPDCFSAEEADGIARRFLDALISTGR